MRRLGFWTRTIGVMVLATVFAIGGARWLRRYWDLHSADRMAAWAEIQRERIYDMAKTADDPRAVKLWLAVGRDPNGHDCAEWGQRPSAFDLAILKPIGMCKPDSSTSMPFMRSTNPESVRLMIAAGVDVNEVSPDGILPLRSAVRDMNEAVVRVLLDAGADPLRRPSYSQIGDLDSAMEVATQLAESKKATPVAIRIRDMLKSRVLAGSARK
jgi:hypothetical protein